MIETGASLSSPFEALGANEDLIQKLVRSFYAHMAEMEPDLARTHRLDEGGRIAEATQERFSRFLIEWLGGPKRYSPYHGHPRLRMRHARVAIDSRQRDAWLRCMRHALDELRIEGDVRLFLDARLAEVADFLRNQPDDGEN